MTTRPRILIAIDPPLLADLVRRALDQDDVDIDITDGSQAVVGSWDIVVVSPADGEHARGLHVVDPDEMESRDFDSLLSLIRSLCGR
jgi:hypothetical protein